MIRFAAILQYSKSLDLNRLDQTDNCPLAVKNSRSQMKKLHFYLDVLDADKGTNMACWYKT